MSVPFIVPKKSGKQHCEKLKFKKCAFPGCKIKQKMTGKGKFCTEHRHRKYRKIIDAAKIATKKAEEESRNPNQTIMHSYTNPVIIKANCKLPGCNNEFKIKIFPNIFVYPKMCPDHRNEYKRNLFIKNQQKF